MIRCAGCGVNVSEWAARCPRCGHAVADSLAAAPPPPAPGAGPALVHGLLLGDAPADPEAEIWSRTGRPAGVRWEPGPPGSGPPTSWPGADGAPGSASDGPPSPAVSDLEAELAAADPPPPSARRRRWTRAGIALGSVLALAAVGALVLRPTGSSDDPVRDLFSVRPMSGDPDERWSVEVDPVEFRLFAHGEGVLYAVAQSRRSSTVVTAYDDGTGDERWTVELPAESFLAAAPSAARTGAILPLGDPSGAPRLEMFDAATGASRWVVEGAQGLVGSALGDRAVAITGGTDGEVGLADLDTETGALAAWDGIPVLGAEGFLGMDEDGEFTLRDPSDGSIVGTWPVGRDVNAAAVVGDLIVVADQLEVSAFDADGERWSFEADGEVSQLFRLSDHRVLMTLFQGGRIVVMDVTGEAPETLWTETDVAFLRLVTRDVAIVNQDGQLRLVRIEADGLSTIVDLAPTEIGNYSLDYAGDEVVVREIDGNVTAFAPDGTAEWTLEVSPEDMMYAVDEALVVVSDTTMTYYD